MRRSHSVSETSVGLFAFLDVLMSTMGSLILVLMIVSPKIRQEKMAKAATEAARDIVKVEPAPTPAPAPVVAPPRETIDLNAKFATRVSELSGQADDKRRTADEKQRNLTTERERANKIRAEREQLERELAQLRATKDTTLASVQDLSAEGLRVESELSKRGSRLRKIQDQIAHESTEYSFVAYDGVSGTTRRPILIECADDQIKFPQENITLTSADISGFTTSTNPVRAGAEALLEYWSTHSKPDDPKPYVLIVVRPSGTLAYYRARNLLQRMNTPFGYELLSEDQKLAVPTPDQAAVTACRQAVDQAIAKRDSVFDSVFANRGGLSLRNPWRRGAGGSRSDVAGASGTGNGGSPNSPFDDPFDLTSNGTKGNGTKGTGKGVDGNALVASGNTMAGGTPPGAAGAGGPAMGGGDTAGSGPGGSGSSNGGASGGVSPGGTGSGGVGPGGTNSGKAGSAGPGSGSIGSRGIAAGAFGSGSNALASGNGGVGGPGDLVGGGTAGSTVGGSGSGVANDPTSNVANGDLKNGSSQKGGDTKGTEGARPVATLAGSAGEETVGGRVSSSGDGQSGVVQSNPAFELLPPPGANRSGGSGDGNVAEHTPAGELGFELPPVLSQSNDSQPGRASLGSGSGPSTPVLQTGTGPSQSGMNNGGLGAGGLEGGGSGASESAATAAGQPGSPAQLSPVQLSPAMAGSDTTQGESGLPGGSPSGGSPGAESGGEQGQPSAGSADPSGGSGMPSFGQSTDGAPNGSPVRHRWGYSSPQASIGFEHDLTIWIGRRTIVVGGQRPLPTSGAESIQRLSALIVPAIDREARAWGRPPDHLYWVPNIKFVVSPGGNLPYERLRPIVERHGLVSSVEYCLEMDSPRQTFQSWVQ